MKPVASLAVPPITSSHRMESAESAIGAVLRQTMRGCDAAGAAVIILDGDAARVEFAAGIATDLPAGLLHHARRHQGHFHPVIPPVPPASGAAALAGMVVAVTPLPAAGGGLLCILDHAPRSHLSDAENTALEESAGLVAEIIALRGSAADAQRQLGHARVTIELLALAYNARDLESAFEALATQLCTTAGGLTCHLWRLLPDETPAAQFMIGWSTEAYGGDGYLATLRQVITRDTSSPTLRSLCSLQQIVIPDITTPECQKLTLLQRAAPRGMRKLIATPFQLEAERFSFVIGFGEEQHDVDGPAALLVQAVTALGPMLHRIRDEGETRLLRRMVEATSDVVLVTEAEPIDLPGPRIVYANPAFETTTGYSVAEVLGLTPRLLHGPETSPEALANIRQALRDWRPVRQTLLNYRKDGTPFWSDLQITPLADSSGWFTHWVSVQRDVTQQREAEQRRAEAEAERDALIEQIPGVLIRLHRRQDGFWGRSLITKAVFQMTGHTVEEALADDWFGANTHPDDYRAAAGSTYAAFREGRSSDEFRFRHKDGRWLWISAIKRGQSNAHGVPEVVSIWSDITVERQLREQLAHSTKLAQLGEVTTGMAHELNQPLASISLAAENALRRLAAPEPSLPGVRQKLDMIVDQAGRISALLDHMRVFGRLEQQPRAAVSLQAVVTDALGVLRSKMKFASVTVDWQAEATLPDIMGSAISIEQVLINLIANACDAYVGRGATGPCKRTIAIHARQEQGMVVVEVRDEAGGIPEAVLPRVFEPFFTTKPVGQGTGLGLSISYGIITDMGGSITVSNRDGGAWFQIRLPAATPDQP